MLPVGEKTFGEETTRFPSLKTLIPPCPSLVTEAKREVSPVDVMKT